MGISTYNVNLGRRHLMYILIAYAINILIQFNPVRPLLQYSFGLLTAYKFVEDHGAHSYTPSCNDIKGFPDVDSTIAFIATAMFWSILPNLVYTFAKVLVPGGDEYLQNKAPVDPLENNTDVSDPNQRQQQQQETEETIRESHMTNIPIFNWLTRNENINGRESTTVTVTESTKKVTFDERLTRNSSDRRIKVVSKKTRKWMAVTTWLQDGLFFWFQHFAKVVKSQLHETSLKLRGNDGQLMENEGGRQKAKRSLSSSERPSVDEFTIKEEALHGAFPKFNVFCMKVHDQFIDYLLPMFGLSRFFDKLLFLRRIITIFSMVLSISTVNHLLTPYGRKMWLAVLEKYYIFGLVCLGVWTDRCYECFKDVFRENLRIFGHIFPGREYETFSSMLYNIVMPRAIFLLVIPQMTGVSLFCSCTCKYPLLLQNQEMKRLLGQLVITNSMEEAYRAEIAYAASSYTPRERLVLWKVYLRSWEIYLLESRLYGYLIGCTIFVSYCVILYVQTTEAVIFVVIFLFIYGSIRALSLAGYTAECLTGFNDDDLNAFFDITIGLRHKFLFDRIDAETSTVANRGDRGLEVELEAIKKKAKDGSFNSSSSEGGGAVVGHSVISSSGKIGDRSSSTPRVEGTKNPLHGD